MNHLKTVRLLWAGLFAGLVLVAGEAILNGLLLGPEWEEVLNERNLEIGPAAGVALLGITLLLGVFLAWLTVILRQRTGSGILSVLEAALTVWLTVFLYTCVWLGLLNIFPWRLMILGIIWGLGETVLAALAASWIYSRRQPA
jgi:hypothetical protein